MLGLILLLALKVCSSDAVQATVGSTITLECTVSGSSYQWQKWLETHWSITIQDSSKYGNANTAFLIIYNIVAIDSGTYRCTTPSSDGLQQTYITLAVTDTDGTWTSWSQWTICSKTCGGGTSTRNRGCTGSNCDGTGVESLDCATIPCPVNGNWGIWGGWSACSTTCGDGILTRYRSCDNPAPAHGGSYCSGLDNETTQCVKPSCPVNGRWSEWRAWSACSTTCGSGTWTRYRSCDNPAPANGGSYCSGSENETTPCYAPICPVEATAGSTISLECTVSGSSYQWQKWFGTHWGSTIQSSSKYGNVNTAFLIIYSIVVEDAGTYRCTASDSGGSQQSSITLAVTDTVGNWTPWSLWTICSVTCGVGTSTRNRVCTDGNCDGSDIEGVYCTTTSCPVHGNWGAWHDWHSCSATCGSGSRSRYQECNNPEPANGGSDCQGNDTEIESCSIKLCPVPSEEDNSSAAIGIGAGIGSTVVVIGLLIGFFVILKRYRLGKPAESAIYTTAGDTASSNSDLHIYSGLQQNTASPTHRQNGVIYDNLIIWKKTNSC